MPIPGPGVPISMTTIATEFGGAVPHSLSEYYRGGGLVPNTPTNAAIPTSGTISMGNFYGSANRAIVSLVISGNVQNYDVFDNRGPNYVAGNTDLTVTINPGVVVGSASTGSFAMLVPSAFSPADTVTIVNNGTIIGAGGSGGSGGIAGQFVGNPGNPGAAGGNALYVNRPTIVTNNGTLASGGGGGGGGGANLAPTANRRFGGGGGGGAGFTGGAGGAGGAGAGPSPGDPGSPGTASAGGSGGAGNLGVYPGGPGGGQGAAGASGTTGPRTAGAGGGTGNYITGNPFVTYPATGTRLGGVA